MDSGQNCRLHYRKEQMFCCRCCGRFCQRLNKYRGKGNKMEQLYRINTNGQADKGAIVQGEKYRFTLLTEEMIRL